MSIIQLRELSKPIRIFSTCVLVILSLMLANCTGPHSIIITSAATETATPTPTSTPEPLTLGAGLRFSTYGIGLDPGPEYWISVGKQMSAKFPPSHPETIWILGNFLDDGMTYLNFHAETDDPNTVSGYVDMNEQTLGQFDANGFEVWLQVEPANADMLTLIDLVMNQCKHHPSVVGFGVDAEWYKSDGSPLGTPISDDEARSWVEAIRAHNQNYKLFLKHWEIEYMPPTYREGIVFINDSQHFKSFEHLVDEFSTWGRHFAPAPVSFQYGYLADKTRWKELQDPPDDIGKALIENIPDTSSLFWVDFTIKEIFPPKSGNFLWI